MEGFLIRVWELSNHPRVRWNLDVVPRRNSRRRCLHKPQPISNQPMGLRFPHRAGGVLTRGISFRPQGVGFVHVWKDFWSGDGTLSSPGVASSMSPS